MPETYKEGDQVRLCRLNRELRANGLSVGQRGIVRSLGSKMGIEFFDYSGVGFNAGLQVIKFNTRDDDGSIIPILHLVERANA